MTGALQRPEILVVGRYRGKDLEVVGRTVKLTEAKSAEIGKLLKPAGARHPWPDQIATHWGRGSKTPIVKVRPVVVVEVAADAALQAGHYRHPLRLVRHRSDLEPTNRSESSLLEVVSSRRTARAGLGLPAAVSPDQLQDLAARTRSRSRPNRRARR